MYIVHVFVKVREEHLEAFEKATAENAASSILEPGIARFDVIRQQDDPTRYVLAEVYRTPEDPARHKETSHYRKWRDTVAGMMAEPRSSMVFTNVFPGDGQWG